MSLPTAYLTSTKNLDGILNALKNAEAPDPFSQAFLGHLGFKSSSDRLIINVLKSLGFLDSSGKPQDRYYQFLDQTQSEVVLAAGIRDAWSDLFQINKNAHKLSATEFKNKLKTLSQGKLKDSVLNKMSMTFSALVKIADFETSGIEQENAGDKDQDLIADESHEATVVGKKMKISGLAYNIQIVLPESRDTKVYDALFSSLTRHLL